ALLAAGDAVRVVAADPLAPAMEVEVPLRLARGQRRIADEPQVGLEPERGQRPRQTVDAAREPTGARVGVRPLEREQVEHHLAAPPPALRQRRQHRMCQIPGAATRRVARRHACRRERRAAWCPPHRPPPPPPPPPTPPSTS